MDKTILQQKTTWTGIAAIIGAIGGYLTGSMDVGTAISTAVAGLIGVMCHEK